MTTRNAAVKVMSGNEAVAAGALAAGVRFFAGYPITPSSEIAEELSVMLPKLGGVFIQMEDEIAAMGAVIGASLAGSKTLTATSGPGFSLKQENIGFACMAEVPVVIVNVMRGGPSTGSPTMPAQGDVMQARWGTHGDHAIVVLAPNSVRESFDLTVRSFNLSEMLRTPVILLLDEIIGHVNEKLTMPESVEVVDRKRPDVPPAEYKPYRHTEDKVPPMAAYGRDGYRFHVTGLAHDETGFPTNNPEEIEKLALRLHAKLERYRDKVVDIERVACDDAEIGIFAYGATSRSAYQTVREARAVGIKVGLLRPRTLWPFPDREVHAFAQQVRTIIVPELNLGQMAHEVEWAAAGACPIDPLMRIDGQPISPRQILERVERAAKGDHL
jgi:2-oxoglutarate/2-oxoacid ferredoxin oxidoreductase subunit alpha